MTKKYICGIYIIVNVVNNSTYVGMSKDILRRWDDHIYQLNKGMHKNTLLQDDFNTYGIDNFSFRIVYQCHKLELRENEDIVIRELSEKRRLYNIAKNHQK